MAENVCRCGHPEMWHESHGMCTGTLTSGGVCPCEGFLRPLATKPKIACGTREELSTAEKVLQQERHKLMLEFLELTREIDWSGPEDEWDSADAP